MNRSKSSEAALAAALVLGMAAASGAAAPGVAPPAPPAAGAGMTRHDLSELRDGETRSYGTGERAIEASRAGDVVTLRFRGDEGARTLTCTVGEDSCYVMTGDAAERVMVFLRRHAPAGEDHDVFMFDMNGGESLPGEPAMVWVGDGDDAMPAAPGAAMRRVVIERDGPGEPGGRRLACPRGDTTMRLEPGDAATGYTCPKHGVALVEDQRVREVRRVIVRTGDGAPSAAPEAPRAE